MAPAGEGAREEHPPWPRGERAVTAKVTTSGRKQQESLRRSTRERGEHENERVDDRRPPSSTCGEGLAKVTAADDVVMERQGSAGGASRS